MKPDKVICLYFYWLFFCLGRVKNKTKYTYTYAYICLVSLVTGQHRYGQVEYMEVSKLSELTANRIPSGQF